MAIRIAPLPEGTRVRVVRGSVPQDPRSSGRSGTVVAASEYRHNQVGVLLDGEQAVRFFLPDELEVTEEPPPPPERLAAKQRKALP
jgi:hypothetical protein